MILDNVETLVAQQKFGAQNVTYGGNTAPTSPGDGDMWYENPLGTFPYPQPWIWNSSNSLWLSSPFFLDFGLNTFSFSGNVEKAVPFYGVTANKILVRQVVGIVTNTTTVAHDASNYWNFAVRYTTGTATPLPGTNAYTLQVDTGINPSPLGGQASRRFLENPNVWIPGNAWSLRLVATKTGSPSNISAHFGYWVQYGRG